MVKTRRMPLLSGTDNSGGADSSTEEELAGKTTEEVDSSSSVGKEDNISEVVGNNRCHSSHDQ